MRRPELVGLDFEPTNAEGYGVTVIGNSSQISADDLHAMQSLVQARLVGELFRNGAR